MRREVEPPSSTDISRFQLWIRPSSPEPVAAQLFLSFADSQSASPTSVGKGSCSHRPLAPTVISPCRQLMASSVNLATYLPTTQPQAQQQLEDREVTTPSRSTAATSLEQSILDVRKGWFRSVRRVAAGR